MTTSEVLRAHVPLVRSDTSVREIAAKMDLYQFSVLTILNPEDQVLAVITEGDICRAAQQHGSLAAIAESPGLAYATTEPQVTSGEIEVGDCFHRMVSSGLSVLPVVRDGRFIGQVHRADLMAAILLGE